MSRKALAEGAKRLKLVRRELFYAYCFVRFDLDDPRWHDCFELAGVDGILCAGNLPVRIPDELIEKNPRA